LKVKVMMEKTEPPGHRLRADEVLDRLKSEFASMSNWRSFSQLLKDLFEKELLALLHKLDPDFQPEKPLPAGKVGPEVPLNKAAFAQMMTAAAAQGSDGAQFWAKDDSELMVATAKVTVELSDGLVVVCIPVWCDQIGDATVQVPFAMGGANTPAGMLVATEEHPRGPDAIIAVWSEPLLAFAWKTLLTVATQVSASTGKDEDGAGLIPAALTATPDGVRILTMARHPFDRVSG
jgi:hypothetical protein